MMEDLGNVITETTFSRGTKRLKYHRNCLECKKRFTGFVNTARLETGNMFPYFCSAHCANIFDQNMNEKNFKAYLDSDA